MQKILFVEDDPTLQKTLCLSLEKEGYEVKPAMDGEIGLSTAKEMKPDLILLDLILPKLDGFEVLAELKKDEATKDILVIVLTNLETTEDIQKALNLGATTYLVKANYDLKDVLEKVKSSIK